MSRYSLADLLEAVRAEGWTAAFSRSTLWRILKRDALRPWRFRSWIFPRDPDFEEKATRVLDLYEGVWEGRALGPDEYVISADEKTSIQARCRCHVPERPARKRGWRVEFEYQRRGAVQYLAAWEVRRGRVIGRTEAHTGIEPFGRLVEQVMSQEPYRSALRVFWLVDNGSSHRGAASVERWQAKYPNLVLVHLPMHASWLNQIEIYFSVIQRKVLTPNDFADCTEVEERLAAFAERTNRKAKPFQWKFTRAEFERRLREAKPEP
ncbi:MAG: IS630 family transposase, partial [Chloroflexi bacterium]|nr:IS630 family transposase [Chloroflexota bacterium]